MAGTTRSNPRDVFEVPLGDKKVYFQYLGKDAGALHSHTIRVFKTKYPIDSEQDLEDVVMGKVDFHAHVIIPRGVKEGFWKKAGPAKRINDQVPVVFRRSDDYGSKFSGISRRWRVWRFGEQSEYVGDLLTGEQKKAEVAPVVPPIDIVERATTGKYKFMYPAGTDNDPYITR